MPKTSHEPALHTGIFTFASPQGRRILVVEDEYVLAKDLQTELECQGAEVTGPVASIPEALDF